MILPLLFALQAAATPAPAAATSPAPAEHKPTPEQLARFQAKLLAMGLPPGMEMPGDQSSPIGEVMLGPLFYQPFMCLEHPQNLLPGLGDALGTDCMVMGGLKGDIGFEQAFRTDGKTNADWYGWQAEVHAPFDGVITAVVINPVTNMPGTMGKPPASGIVFQRADGMNVVFGHIMTPRVKVGDHVVMGQVVAVDGNNGMARAPHIHIGAWKDGKSYQIRWDLAVEGRIPGLTDN